MATRSKSLYLVSIQSRFPLSRSLSVLKFSRSSKFGWTREWPNTWPHEQLIKKSVSTYTTDMWAFEVYEIALAIFTFHQKTFLRGYSVFNLISFSNVFIPFSDFSFKCLFPYWGYWDLYLGLGVGPCTCIEFQYSPPLQATNLKSLHVKRFLFPSNSRSKVISKKVYWSPIHAFLFSLLVCLMASIVADFNSLVI